MYAHVNFWMMNPDGATSNNLTAREMAARLSEQPGFVSYSLIRTGEREVVAVTIFESKDQLETALNTVADFVHERVQPLAAGEPERHAGAVLYHATGQVPRGDA
jgi:quinol monooxygenase YgiN